MKIRSKFLIIFMLLVLFLTLGGILLNSLFLESYYISKNKHFLVHEGNLIKEEYLSDNANIENHIFTEARAHGTNIFILDNNSNIVYTSIDLKSSKAKKFIPHINQNDYYDNKHDISEKDVKYIEKDKNNEDDTKLMYTVNLDDGNSLILIKYVKSIQDSVKTANQFYIISGSVLFIAGSVFVLFFSKKITKPIVEMSNVAENISNLNFNDVVNVTSKDEIGNLGQSINKISRKLDKSLNDLKNDLERRKALVRNISHELKTPIGIIKGYSEGMKYGLANTKEKMDNYCSILVDECDRMDSLVKELLDYTMLDDGLTQLHISDFHIKDFLYKISDRFKYIFNQNNIKFNIDCREDCLISADTQMIEKAVNNFITNAIKYVDDKKIISLKGKIINNDTLKISVFNSGQNIPNLELDKIWDVCYKVDKSRTRELGGHGIGLSLVKLIAQLHNGTYYVENNNDGVTFSLEIPIKYCEK